ncbi:cell division protein FtsL [Marinobacter sp. X15-166B]|uniref:cell division protein FtsL n=1 Tax=Marinobacter sp. X15-166B TaxID=1897620 RepID=UPI00085C33DA|nr:cell division protein FtsL [Marinobacter sp. X15-166B]OEY66691.1 cell division protein FtsL [Marinobacter sp. X15-166B]
MGAVTLERPVKTAVLNKHKVREGLSTALRLSQRIFRGLGQGNVLVFLGLVTVLIVSAIGVVVSSHQNRQLFNALSQLQQQRDGYHREWSQLLLEQSSLGAHGRIEQQAAQQLGMTVPGKQDIVLVPNKYHRAQ